jgi:hypothetical protein
MSFLGWPIEHYALSEQARRRRKATILRLIRLFADTFVDIDYDLLWEHQAINAQAWLSADRRHVTLCGGLVRHPAMTACGIALTLAHETGHHLGGPPFDPDLRWLTWQGQADYWAAKEGMPKVFGRNARCYTLRGAREIEALHDEFRDADDKPDMSANDRLMILRAGARGESPPACFTESYNRILKERDAYLRLSS